ncbi:hypothetical protein [Niabella sp.]|uniref:hypothetical protein n=1 Tax=Niabella sp. TaxID=1962976 RepID=UPI002616CBA9|nr:hypothetical protein [Niabella sp.]
MKNLFLSIFVVSLLAACSKKEQPPLEQDKIEMASIKVEDTIALNQNINVEVNANGTGTPYTYIYHLEKQGVDKGTIANTDGKAAISTKGLAAGQYSLDILIKSKNGTFVQNSKPITILNPDFGVALFGNSKEKVLETEKLVNKNEPYQALIGFESKWKDISGIEKVQFRNGNNVENYVYYFLNNKLIAGEAFVPEVTNCYATYDSVKKKYNSYFNGFPEVLATFKEFSGYEYTVLYNAGDYLSISNYIRNGQFTENASWKNTIYPYYVKGYGNAYIKVGSQNKVYTHFEIGLSSN